jgi:hypothetical protein
MDRATVREAAELPGICPYGQCTHACHAEEMSGAGNRGEDIPDADSRQPVTIWGWLRTTGPTRFRTCVGPMARTTRWSR